MNIWDGLGFLSGVLEGELSSRILELMDITV